MTSYAGKNNIFPKKLTYTSAKKKKALEERTHTSDKEVQLLVHKAGLDKCHAAPTSTDFEGNMKDILNHSYDSVLGSISCKCTRHVLFSVAQITLNATAHVNLLHAQILLCATCILFLVNPSFNFNQGLYNFQRSH